MTAAQFLNGKPEVIKPSILKRLRTYEVEGGQIFNRDDLRRAANLLGVPNNARSSRRQLTLLVLGIMHGIDRHLEVRSRGIGPGVKVRLHDETAPYTVRRITHDGHVRLAGRNVSYKANCLRVMAE